MYKAAINICVQVLECACWIICKRMFCFVRDRSIVFQSSCTVLQSHQQWMRGSCYPTLSPTLDVVSVPDVGHSNRCGMIAQGFNLHFSDDILCRVSFHKLFVICMSSLVRCLLRSLAHFSFYSFIYLLIFGSAGFLLPYRLFSSCDKRGLLSSCSSHAFH